MAKYGTLCDQMSHYSLSVAYQEMGITTLFALEIKLLTK